LTKN
ncbi:type III secretion low calcium response chaperone LcrH/SycD, partial [Chlamydia psittaci C1/97]|jgi:hypothetical protein